MLIPKLIPAALMIAVSTAAFAAPAPDAQKHFQAIAFGDINHIMQQYSNGAVLQWVGGPLNGTYFGPTQIRRAWTKFTKAVAPGTFEVSNVNVAGDMKGMTVTANVEFDGRKDVKVRYVLVYRHGKLVDEVWQVDPDLQVG
jgi:ketosteroid isomerase-like protein